MNSLKTTHPVSDEIFRTVYDSPAALPGRYKWLTRSEDVRKIEELLGMPPETIGAPLWVSGDRKHCPKCRREVNWLDIVASALDQVNSRGRPHHPPHNQSRSHGLRVEAWDKDRLYADLVGSAVADAQGAFRIEFDESYFQELFQDQRPDLFFKVFQGDALIRSTEDAVLWNVEAPEIEVVIEVDAPAAEEPLPAA